MASRSPVINKAAKNNARRHGPDSDSSSSAGVSDSVISKRKHSKVAASSKKSEKPVSDKLTKADKEIVKPTKPSPPPAKPSPSVNETSSEGIADELGITKGTVIPDKNGNYVVLGVLGEGGFGAVLEVHREGKKNEMHYAMKIEKRGRRHNKLKMEVAILKLIRTARENNKLPKRESGSHFTDIFGRGKMETYVFLVMELVGKSLSDVKYNLKDNVFSVGTGIFAASQCLEAVEDLHTLNYIHRDIKPANYATGVGSRQRFIYILDFGIARRIVNKEGQLRTPRAFVGFKGTVRFASRSCHNNMELGFLDDCESWFYLLLDLIVKGGLPWRRLENAKDVKAKKEECIRDKSYYHRPHQPYEKQFNAIIQYISELKYEQRVDYDFIYKSLTLAAKACGIQKLKDVKLDWT